MRVVGAYDWKAYDAKIREEIRLALEKIAREMPGEFQARIRNGQAPDGSPQKQNLPETIIRKRKRYGSDTPLVRTGRLADRYTVRKLGSMAWEIHPPNNRGEALSGLLEDGYSVLGAPAGTDAKLTNALAEAAVSVESATPGYRR